jgi:hypothetical protein
MTSDSKPPGSNKSERLFVRARRAQSGDDPAWEELFRAVYPDAIRSVRRMLAGLMRSVLDSTDFASDVLKGLADHAERLDFPSLAHVVAFLKHVLLEKVKEECGRRYACRIVPLPFTPVDHPGLKLATGRGGVGPAEGMYFPDLAFGENKTTHDFRVEWYTKHLRAMQEPTLWALCPIDLSTTVYRLLWLPTFGHPVCVRIVRSGAITALHATRLSGRGGYEPGKIAVKKQLELNEAQWDGFVRKLAQANFWTLPTRINILTFDGRPVIGLDGDRLILEGVLGGKYHIVDRHSPKGGSYVDLCGHMIQLSRFRIKGARNRFHPAPAPTPKPLEIEDLDISGEPRRYSARLGGIMFIPHE